MHDNVQKIGVGKYTIRKAQKRAVNVGIIKGYIFSPFFQIPSLSPLSLSLSLSLCLSISLSLTHTHPITPQQRRPDKYTHQRQNLSPPGGRFFEIPPLGGGDFLGEIVGHKLFPINCVLVKFGIARAACFLRVNRVW